MYVTVVISTTTIALPCLNSLVHVWSVNFLLEYRSATYVRSNARTLTRLRVHTHTMDDGDPGGLPLDPAIGAAFLRMLVDGTVRQTFDAHALAGCEVHDVRAERGVVTCKVFVRPTTANMFGAMHGGCIATLVDVVSTAALVTVTGKPGVSVSLALNYVRPGSANRELEVRSTVVKYGLKLGTISTDVVDVASGETVATGTHVKAISSREASLEHLASKL